MSDNLVIGGATFTGVTGIKATDTADNVVTFESGGEGVQSGTVIGSGAISISVPVSGTPTHLLITISDVADIKTLTAYQNVGVYGDRSRDEIAAWTRNHNNTGFQGSASFTRNNWVYTSFNNGVFKISARTTGTNTQIFNSSVSYKWYAW